MDVTVKTACSDNTVFARNHIRAASNNEAGVHAFHHIWISGFAYACDYAVFDANVGLVDAGPIYDQGIRDHSIQDLVIGSSARLTHTFTQGLASTKRAFIAVPSHIFFDLDPQICSSKPDQIACCGAEHANVCLSLHGTNVDVRRITRRLWFVQETSSLDVLHNIVRHLSDKARGNLVSALDDLVARNLYQCYRLGVARFETDRSACGNVQTVAVRSYTIKLKLRVGLDEVVVRPDLGIVSLCHSNRTLGYT